MKPLIGRVMACACACAWATSSCGATSVANSSSGSDAGALGADGAPGGDAGTSSACSMAKVNEIEITTEGLRGYPPYAIADCKLAYVAPSGELRLRDLESGADTLLAPSSDKPKAPAISGELVAWEATVEGRTRVRVSIGGAIVESPSDLVFANELRASGGAVVFTGWRSPPPSGESDVWVLEAGASRTILGGPGQQRFADIDERWIAVSDFSEDPDGTYDQNERDLADVVLVDRVTGEVVRRASPGKQAFPMLAELGHVAYLDWNAVHPEPKFEAFKIRVGAERGLVSEDRFVADVRHMGAPTLPIARGGTIEWVADTDTGVSLFRASADGSRPAAIVADSAKLSLATPSSTRAATIVAGELRTSTPPRLRAITR